MRALFHICRSRRLRANGFRTRRALGALLALAGFVSQYPIPVIHQCPVMNPHGMDLLAAASDDTHVHHDHGNHHDHAEHGAEPARQLAGVAEAGADPHAHLPACHRRLLALTQKDAPAADSDAHAAHASGEAAAHAGDHGPHSHESCPVCQGHAQLLPDLPQSLSALDTHFYFLSLRRLAPVQPIVQPELEQLPDSRAPPA